MTTTEASAAPVVAAAPAGAVVGRIIANIDETNPGVAVVRKTTGSMGAASPETLARAALRLLQDVALLAQTNPALSPFQRYRRLSHPQPSRSFLRSPTVLPFSHNSPYCALSATVVNGNESFIVRMKDERTFTIARITSQ